MSMSVSVSVSVSAALSLIEKLTGCVHLLGPEGRKYLDTCIAGECQKHSGGLIVGDGDGQVDRDGRVCARACMPACVYDRGSSGRGAMENSYEERCIAIQNAGHSERRRGLRIGNPIARRAEVLHREARRVERQEMLAGMGVLRRKMAARERAAMKAEDPRR